VDPPAKNNDFKDSCGLEFTLLSDAGAKVSEAYGTALDIPFLGKFSNRQTYIISPVSARPPPDLVR
jgi:thioredoxin-dependent peroxiredoxin